MGPGRGTLTKDIIRVLSKFGLSSQISLHLVEISPHLTKLQAQNICFTSSETNGATAAHHQGETATDIPVYWYHKIEDIPKGFSIILAHEFFDALPINKFQKVDGKWKEVLIDLDPSIENEFRLIVSQKDTVMLNLFVNIIQTNNETRNHIEYNFETHRIMEYLANFLEIYGGFGLIMDYGHFAEKSDTFRVIL